MRQGRMSSAARLSHPSSVIRPSVIRHDPAQCRRVEAFVRTAAPAGAGSTVTRGPVDGRVGAVTGSGAGFGSATSLMATPGRSWRKKRSFSPVAAPTAGAGGAGGAGAGSTGGLFVAGAGAEPVEGRWA